MNTSTAVNAAELFATSAKWTQVLFSAIKHCPADAGALAEIGEYCLTSFSSSADEFLDEAKRAHNA